MYSPILLEEAKQEWLDTSLYYETKRIGLGERFNEAVENGVLTVAQNPKHYKKVKKEYRQLLLKKFPFLIVFRIDEENKTVVIVAVFHAKRNSKNKFNRE